MRVNPNISAETHPYISTGQHAHKFGVPWPLAHKMIRFAQSHPWLKPVALAAHIGSQIVDSAPFMNDLLRPTLYSTTHPIKTVKQPTDLSERTTNVVGPICETGDFLAKERPLPPTAAGDYLAVLQAGAYGFAMGSNYNGRLRPAEVLVNEAEFTVIRQRQSFKHLLDGCV